MSSSRKRDHPCFSFINLKRKDEKHGWSLFRDDDKRKI
jgi:hypothetical protein